MASSTEINIGQQVQFYGSLMGTTGITEENNKICNDRINSLLIALEPFHQDYIDEAKEAIEFREAEKKRMAEDAPSIIAPTSFDMNNLKIK